MFYTYILKSSATEQLYIGQTNNLEDRLKRHNNNQNKATKNRGPWSILHSEVFESRTEAMQLERKLKSWKNPKKVLSWIESRQA